MTRLFRVADALADPDQRPSTRILLASRTLRSRCYAACARPRRGTFHSSSYSVSALDLNDSRLAIYTHKPYRRQSIASPISACPRLYALFADDSHSVTHTAADPRQLTAICISGLADTAQATYDFSVLSSWILAAIDLLPSVRLDPRAVSMS